MAYRFEDHMLSLLSSDTSTSTSLKSIPVRNVPFKTYTCTCGIDPNLIYCELKDKKHAACIIKNYLLYLEFRNMKQFMSPVCIALLENYTTETPDIRKIILTEPTKKFNNGSEVKNYTLRLHLSSPLRFSELDKAAELIAQIEFINFVKSHMIFITLDKDIENAIETLKIVNQSNAF